MSQIHMRDVSLEISTHHIPDMQNQI